MRFVLLCFGACFLAKPICSLQFPYASGVLKICYRRYLAAIHNDMDYDEEEDAKNFTIAPEMPEMPLETAPSPKQKTPPQPAPIVQKLEVSLEASVATSQFMSRRVATASIRSETKMQEVREVQKDEEAMMLSLAGIMKTVRGMMKGSAEEQADIKKEMKSRIHKV